MASAMSSSAETSLRLWTCFVNGEGATAEGTTIHGFNGLLCLLRRSHGNKTKSSGTPADPVNHQIRFHYGAVRRKSVVQFIFRCVKREVSNKQLRVHVMYYYALLELPLRLPDCSRPPGFRSSPNRVRLKILHAVDSNSYRADARKIAHFAPNATKIFEFFQSLGFLAEISLGHDSARQRKALGPDLGIDTITVPFITLSGRISVSAGTPSVQQSRGATGTPKTTLTPPRLR